MDTITLIVAGIFGVIILGLFGLLVFLQQRSKTHGPLGGPSMDMKLPPHTAKSRLLFRLWAAMLGVTVLFIVITLVTGNLIFAWVAGGCLAASVVIRWAQVITRFSQK